MEGYCGRCLKQVVVWRKKTSIILNSVLTVLTAGIWFFFWLKSAKKMNKNWICAECGNEVYKIMQ